MSYTRTYHNSVTFSGSKTVSYPASEHGGTMTVSYSGTVPVTTNIHVDTDPFDASIRGANTGIDLLTGSVVAMESAEVIAKKEASNKIADRLIGGFYSLISNDLTTQRSESITLVKAKFALLKEYSQGVADKKERMESDTARLKTYYGSVFENIDKDMITRIEALDRNVFKIKKGARDELIMIPGKSAVTSSYIQTKESGTVDGLVYAARLRSRISTVLSAVSDYVKKSSEYKKTVNNIMSSGESEQSQIEYVPVILHSSQDINAEYNGKYKFFAPEFDTSDKMISKVNEYSFSVKENEWQNIPNDDLSKIEREFNGYMEASSAASGDSSEHNQRVYKEVVRLWGLHKADIRILY